IESEEQRDLLISLGCEYGQGYLLEKPMGADEAEALAAAGSIVTLHPMGPLRAEPVVAHDRDVPEPAAAPILGRGRCGYPRSAAKEWGPPGAYARHRRGATSPVEKTMTSTPNADGRPNAVPPETAPIVAKHADKLRTAVAAIAGRGYWSAYPESPSPRVYGEGKAEAGRAAYEAHLGKRFELGQPGADGWVGAEGSPYGPALGVTYEHMSPDALVAAAGAALPGWREAGPDLRAAVCIEIIDRINERSFELANAVMHTSGQAFVMAFQAGGPHAQD